MAGVAKLRKAQRAQFTKALNEYNASIAGNNDNEAKVQFILLCDQWERLETTNSNFLTALCEIETTPDTEIESAVSSHADYQKKFTAAKQNHEKRFPENERKSTVSEASVIQVTAAAPSQAPYKRPTLEIPKFNGDLGKWLEFWSHFCQYHEDKNLSDADKLHYLKSAMEPNSKAYSAINGLPNSKENYAKAIKVLQDRFGREKLLSEYYMRELLQMAIQNAMNKGKKVVELATLYDKISTYVLALESLGIRIENYMIAIFPLVESSLPEETLRTWQRYDALNSKKETEEEQGDEENELERLLKFLRIEVENEEKTSLALKGFSTKSDADKKEKPGNKEKAEPSRDIPTATALVSTTERKKRCIFCDEQHQNHDSAQCRRATKLGMEERRRVVSDNGCCFKCLKPRHRAKDCRVKVNCIICSGRHETILCNNNNSSHVRQIDSNLSKNQSESDLKNKVLPRKEENLASFCNSPDVYLQTLRLVLYNGTREKVVRAVIDGGSERSYISCKVAKELGYEPVGSEEIVHALFGGINSKREKHNVYLAYMRDIDNTYACNFEVRDKQVICGDIRKIESSNCLLNELKEKNISLCDLKIKSNDDIDVLIGMDVCNKLLTGKKYHLSNGLTVEESKFGHIISGKLNKSVREDTATVVNTMFVTDAKISDLWSLDVLGITDPIEKRDRKLEEEQLKKNFLETVRLNENLRYTVDLPWKNDHAPVSENYSVARKRLGGVVKRLEESGNFTIYDNVFKDWHREGVIEKVPESEVKDCGHYLPHRPVFKPESRTTPVRPVFDASAHEIGHPCLNQCLETGPNLIELIPSSILKFRQHEIGVLADVKKAFLQIEINKVHQNFLRFFWFDGKNVAIFRHLRLIFGLTCSPFILAVIFEYHFSRVLEAIERKEVNWSAEVVKKLRSSFYVDNCATSVKNKEELEIFIKQSTEIMKTGGFDLRGWEFTGDQAKNDKVLVLGLLYDKILDTLSVNPSRLNFPVPIEITMRVILRACHKPYDPIGATCPAFIRPKIILKGLHKRKMKWDEPVDERTTKEFLEWYGQLPVLEKIKIPRKIGEGSFTLHVFNDGSIDAYATVIFLRIDRGNNVELIFLGAKSRVTPGTEVEMEKLEEDKNFNKKGKITIPRIELLGALIGSRLSAEIIKSLELKDVPIYYWTDSSTVLAWIKRDLQWGTFVRNRVKEIREITNAENWYYVPGEFNPADLPSRGCSPQKLLDSRWWEGPDWLRQSSQDWPKQNFKIIEDKVLQELKKTTKTNLISLNRINDIKLTEHFSSFDKLIRFYVIMQKFKNFKLRKNYFGKRLTFKEIKDTELRILTQLQSEMFSSNDQKLASFETFKDDKNLIRLKTKIVERDDSFPFLCPIILDGKHEIVMLIIREAHEKMCHAGVQTVMCHLREKFWILSMRKTVKSVIRKCTVCMKQSAQRMNVEPATLPVQRVKDAAVFEIIGVDLAGPIFLKGGQKGWICLYTCAVYRAVHLELVTSLSTIEFLSSFKRFIARRGRPSLVYSDNGTNFVGTNNALKELDWDVISKYSNTEKIDWHFNPPTAAWWGGWWERLIGMMKCILRRVLGKACLSYEEMITVLCDCESTLNSRPLTYVSEDPKDLRPLTPSMFLHDLRSEETPDFDVINAVDLNKRIQYKQQVSEHLRNRFRKEYLSQLVLKPNKRETRILKEGDIVLIGDDSQKRIDWPMARIEKLIVGRQGVVRVAILRTQRGLCKRPIQRIYPLEIESVCGSLNEPEKIVITKIRKDFVDEKVKTPESYRTETVTVSNQKTDHETSLELRKTHSGRIVKKPDYFRSQ